MLITLKPDEKLVKVFRHTHVVSWWYYFLIFILIVAPFFFMFLLFSWGNWGIALFAASLSLGAYLLLRAIYFRYYNALVVSDERVMVAGRHGFLHKTVLELGHDNIVNVSYQIKGFFPTIFRYGKVEIQTARGGTNLEFDFLGRPHAVSELINHTRGEAVRLKYGTGGGVSASSIIENLDYLSSEDLKTLRDAIDERVSEDSDEADIV